MQTKRGRRGTSRERPRLHRAIHHTPLEPHASTSAARTTTRGLVPRSRPQRWPQSLAPPYCGPVSSALELPALAPPSLPRSGRSRDRLCGHSSYGMLCQELLEWLHSMLQGGELSCRLCHVCTLIAVGAVGRERLLTCIQRASKEQVCWPRACAITTLRAHELTQRHLLTPHDK